MEFAYLDFKDAVTYGRLNRILDEAQRNEEAITLLPGESINLVPTALHHAFYTAENLGDTLAVRRTPALFAYKEIDMNPEQKAHLDTLSETVLLRPGESMVLLTDEHVKNFGDMTNPRVFVGAVYIRRDSY